MKLDPLNDNQKTATSRIGLYGQWFFQNGTL